MATFGQKKLVQKKAIKITKLEIRTIQDMAEALAEIQRIVETNKNNLPRQERQKIATTLQKTLNKKDIFKKGLLNQKKIYQNIDSVTEEQLQELKDRMAKAPEKEREILNLEIQQEQEKLKIGKTIIEHEQMLDQWINSFIKLIETSIQHMRGTMYYQKVKEYLSEARIILARISELIQKMKIFEEKLIKITEEEKKLLKKEKEIT